MLAFKALVTSQLQWRNAEIRFCSVSQSGFEPSLSGFVPAPTADDLRAKSDREFFARGPSRP
jgi:hypothetical protein